MKATQDHGRDIRRQLGEREQASGLTCPACHGGPSRERSVSAWRQGLELGAKCWRAKCGWWAKWDVMDVGGLPRPGARQGAIVKRYGMDTLPLTDAIQAALEARYRLHPETMLRYGLRQTAGARACYCPVDGPTGSFRGWVRRWLDGTKPKVKGFPADTMPVGGAWQAWFRPAGHEVLPGYVVAVEDVFSAMRLAQAGVLSVSLLGVALSAVKANELRHPGGFGYKDVVVALDADAYTRAIAHGIRYTVHVRRLSVDVKDMTEEELQTWISCLYSSLRVSAPEQPAM